jgi:hypothetical protein
LTQIDSAHGRSPMISEVADIAGYAVTLTGVFYIYKSYLFIWLCIKDI